MDFSRPGPQPGLRSWISWFMLIMALWLTIGHLTLIFEVGRLVFGSFLLSLAIYPLANWLRRWRIPRGLTVVIVYAGLGGVLVLIGALLIPVISTEVQNLRNQGPDIITSAFNQLEKSTIFRKWVPSTQTVSQDLSQRLDLFVQQFVTTVTRVGSFALELFIVLILTFFFVTDVNMADRLLAHWVPAAYKPRVRAVASDIRYRLARWVWAQTGIALYFAIVFSVGLAIFGVPFALAIGLVGGILELVPYLGGIVAWLLAIFAALTVNPLLIVWVTIFYVVVVEVETHIIAPTLYGRAIGLHPALVLIALIIGAKTGGISGVLFSVPVAVVVLVLLQEARRNYIEPGGEHEPAAGPSAPD